MLRQFWTWIAVPFDQRCRMIVCGIRSKIHPARGPGSEGSECGILLPLYQIGNMHRAVNMSLAAYRYNTVFDTVIIGWFENF
jgi:hypothetical protein